MDTDGKRDELGELVNRVAEAGPPDGVKWATAKLASIAKSALDELDKANERRKNLRESCDIRGAALERAEAELDAERKLHLGDHEVIEALTGLTGAHMWKPPQAREWREYNAPRAEELAKLKAKLAEANERIDDLEGDVAGLTDGQNQVEADLEQRLDAALAEVEGVRHALISMQDTMAFSARDWAVGEDVAWLWGVVCGWPDGAMREMRERYRWTEEQCDRLRGLHASVKAVLGPDAVDPATPDPSSP